MYLFDWGSGRWMIFIWPIPAELNGREPQPSLPVEHHRAPNLAVA